MRTRVEKHSWTKDRVSTLRKLWLEGLSATEIGQRLGCTRNAVLGKVHRIGLSGRRTPVRKSIERRADRLSPKLALRSNVPVRAKRVEPASPPPIKAPEPPAPRPIPKGRYRDPLPGSKPVASIDLATGCRFPLGQYPFAFCNLPVIEGGSWCADHAAIVFQQNPKALKGAGTFNAIEAELSTENKTCVESEETCGYRAKSARKSDTFSTGKAVVAGLTSLGREPRRHSPNPVLTHGASSTVSVRSAQR